MLCAVLLKASENQWSVACASSFCCQRWIPVQLLTLRYYAKKAAAKQMLSREKSNCFALGNYN